MRWSEIKSHPPGRKLPREFCSGYWRHCEDVECRREVDMRCSAVSESAIGPKPFVRRRECQVIGMRDMAISEKRLMTTSVGA
jgi:hypothetical protein